MLIQIKCPKCKTEGSLKLIEKRYQGPYRCWKCRALFTITLKNDQLLSCKPLSEEGLKRQQETKAIQDKLKRQFPGR